MIVFRFEIIIHISDLFHNEMKISTVYSFVLLSFFATKKKQTHSTCRSERYKYPFESIAKALCSTWRDRFCRSESIARAFNTCDLFGVVAITVLLPIIQNNRTSAPNMQSTHSPGISNVTIQFHRPSHSGRFIPCVCVYSTILCAKAKRFLDPSTIFHTDIDEAMQRITDTVQTLKHFRTLFDKYKEKLDTYFIPNQRSVGVLMFIFVGVACHWWPISIRLFD